ncbi:hypothetical protein N1851_000036 [Merluccius polli]|uniref:Uncharacterized protein n=1 Tax=Merluccius polli TaxID=89951 RepID=A0AA47NDM6_MERPO|nr:hypothetical protein N1851_000036 [Merluccius polli]
MSQNYLQLNTGNTELIVISPKQQLTQFEDVALSCVKNLGVLFNHMLSFDQHVKSITRTAFFHLRNIAKIRPMLSAADAETLIHAFILSRLDYCNALFSGLTNSTMQSLQLVQNAAA